MPDQALYPTGAGGVVYFPHVAAFPPWPGTGNAHDMSLSGKCFCFNA